MVEFIKNNKKMLALAIVLIGIKLIADGLNNEPKTVESYISLDMPIYN